MKRFSNDDIKKEVKNCVMIIAGAILYALAVNIFVDPNKIAPGGATGLAMIAEHFVNVPIGIGIFIINLPLFIIAFKTMKLRFVLLSFFAMSVTSAFIDLSAPFIPAYKSDMLLASIFGGVILGVGLGLILRSSATTGGSDLFAAIVTRKRQRGGTGLSVGTVIMLADGAVVLLSAWVFGEAEFVLYSVILIYICSKVIDSIVYGDGGEALQLIITSKKDEVTAEIFRVLERGTTSVAASGGYTGDDRTLIICAVTRKEVTSLHNIVKKCDENAFVISAPALGIYGNGFSKW